MDGSSRLERSAKHTLRRRLFAVHGLLGITAALFIALVTTTGVLTLFRNEIDWVLTPALRATGTNRECTWDRVHHAAIASVPGGTVQSIIRPYGPRFAYRALVSDYEARRYEVFVDPRTCFVGGFRPLRTDVDTSLSYALRQFHVRLFMGAWGRVFVGVIGVLLLALSVTGLWLMRDRLRVLLQRSPARTGRPGQASLHKRVALWTLLFNVVMALSGAVLGLENFLPIYRRWRQERAAAAAEARPDPKPPASRSSEPARSESPPSTPVPPRETPSSAPTTNEVATRPNQPRVEDPPRRLAPTPSEVSLIAEALVRDTDVDAIRLPNDDEPNYLLYMTPRGVAHRVYETEIEIDARNGRVMRVSDGRRTTWLHRGYDMLEPVHYGTFLDVYGSFVGYSVRLLWFVLGLAPLLLAITGFRMWLSRRTSRAGHGPSQQRRHITFRAGLAAYLLLTLALSLGRTALMARPANFGVMAFCELFIAKPLTLMIALFPITLGVLYIGLLWSHSRATIRAAAMASAVTGIVMALWQFWMTFQLV